MSNDTIDIAGTMGMEFMEEEHAKTKKIRAYVLSCIFITVIFVSIGPAVFGSTWVSSSDFHSCIEIVGSFFALIAGGVCLAYFFALKNRFYLIIGLGFLVAGSEDFVHGILAWNRLFEDSSVDFSRFIPGTYVAGRTVLATMTIAAPFLEQAAKKVVNEKREAYFFSGLAMVLGAGATILAFMLPLPQFIFPERLISRPVDFVSAVLFLTAFLLIIKRFLARRTVFCGMLLLSILFNLGGQIYMSFSKTLYDIFFDVAHWANVLSYTTLVVGISIQGLKEIQMSKRALFKRKQAEEKLQEAYEVLEIKVQERTSELTVTNKLLTKENTEHKKSKEALQESEGKLNSMLRSIGDHISMIDKDLNIIWANETAKKIFGDDIVGKKCYQVYHKRKEPCEPYPCLTLKAFQDGKVHEYDTQAIDGNGEIIYFHRTANVALRDKEGKPTAVLEISRDITERKQMEDALRESEQKFRSLVETTNDWVWEVDWNGVYTYASPRVKDLLGYEPEEILGKTPFDLMPPDEAKRVANLFKDIVESRKSFGGLQNTNFHKNGQQVILETNGTPFFDEAGNLLGFRGIDRNITERKRAEEVLEATNKNMEDSIQKLNRSNQQLQEFVYIASHDLREPSRKMFSFGQLLAESLAGKLNDDEQENLDFIIDGAKRMQQMVESLLVYSRVTTKAVTFEEVDLNTMVEELKNLELADKLEETGGNILIPEPLPVVRGDTTQTRQLLQNLISNALKYHKKDVSPEVTIRAYSQDDGMVHVEIEDNGIGIEEKQYNNIFVMFRRLHSRKDYDGTGIGLAICKKIVERHKGKIGVSSIYGQGSTFWFTVPTVKSPEREQNELVSSFET